MLQQQQQRQQDVCLFDYQVILAFHLGFKPPARKGDRETDRQPSSKRQPTPNGSLLRRPLSILLTLCCCCCCC